MMKLIIEIHTPNVEDQMKFIDEFGYLLPAIDGLYFKQMEWIEKQVIEMLGIPKEIYYDED